MASFLRSLLASLFILGFSFALTAQNLEPAPDFVGTAPLTLPTRLRILDTSASAMQARLDIIRSAQRDLIASYFIIDNDITSMVGLAMMREAAREKRGVRTRIIADSFFHRLSRPLMKHLADEGVEIREHHPMDWRHPIWTFQRMHDKLLVADNRDGVLGGRNISLSYFDLETGEVKNFVDRDVRVTGDFLTPLGVYFDHLWKSDHVRIPKIARISWARAKKAEKELDEALEKAKTFNWFERSSTYLGSQDDHTGKIKILTNEIRGNDRKIGNVRNALAEIAKSAQESIVIESPYLVPTAQLFQIARDAIESGVKIKIITSSTQSNDGVLPAGGYLHFREALAGLGIELYEYQGPGALHAKSAVIDGKIAIIGSYNLDPRSAFWNSELAVVSYDPKVANDLIVSIEKHIQRSKLVAQDGELIGPLDDFKGLSFWKSSQIRCARIAAMLSPTFRNQL